MVKSPLAGSLNKADALPGYAVKPNIGFALNTSSEVA